MQLGFVVLASKKYFRPCAQAVDGLVDFGRRSQAPGRTAIFSATRPRHKPMTPPKSHKRDIGIKTEVQKTSTESQLRPKQTSTLTTSPGSRAAKEVGSHHRRGACARPVARASATRPSGGRETN